MNGHPRPAHLTVTVVCRAPLSTSASTFVYCGVKLNVHCIVALIAPSTCARGGTLAGDAGEVGAGVGGAGVGVGVGGADGGGAGGGGATTFTIFGEELVELARKSASPL
jgi:hypothetical protein